jgi:hypothetical protein
MARIRSIHPGLFSDPEFAALSADTQVFYLGLLTEADDNGIFEWKPATLRIRLRPCKDGPVEGLLSELEQHEKVRAYEVDGRKYGAIRNFRKFQRPKSPKSWHPMPDDFRNWVGLSGSTSENHPQMEEEGGRREEGSKKESAAPAREDVAFAEWQSAADGFGWPQAEFITSTRRFRISAALDVCGGLDGWKKALEKASEAGFFLDENDKCQPWFTLDWLLDQDHLTRLLEGRYADRRQAPAPKPRYGKSQVDPQALPSAEPWEQRMQGWRDRKQWLPTVWGPPPGESGCRVPPRLLQ